MKSNVTTHRTVVITGIFLVFLVLMSAMNVETTTKARVEHGPKFSIDKAINSTPLDLMENFERCRTRLIPDDRRFPSIRIFSKV